MPVNDNLDTDDIAAFATLDWHPAASILGKSLQMLPILQCIVAAA